MAMPHGPLEIVCVALGVWGLRWLATKKVPNWVFLAGIPILCVLALGFAILGGGMSLSLAWEGFKKCLH